MKPNTNLFCHVVIIFLLCVSFNSAAGNRTDNSYVKSGDLECPRGFKRIPSGAACAATNIVTTATSNILPDQSCPTGFERTPGLRFCVAKNLTVEILRGITLISSKNSPNCPDGFSRAVGSTICTADNLVLKVINNEVTLATLPTTCPEGFHKPDGIRFCIAKNLVSDQLPDALPSQCPAGFVKPAGVHFCIATDILYTDNSRQNDLIPPQGLCPENWHRPINVNFCIPKNIVSQVGTNQNGAEQKTVTLHVKPIFEGTICPDGKVEIWWDMPIYDEEGLFVIDFLPTRTCITEKLKPVG